ncbi:MAG: DegV family protein [Raoultibacter sp.]
MIKIITDSVTSIPHEMLEGTGVEVITLFINRDGVEYADATMDRDAFYADIYDMVDDLPTSSQPSQATLIKSFEACAQAGDEVLGIFISSGLSGTYEGATRAARSVKSRNVGFNFSLIDSASCGFDEAPAVLDAIEAVAAGKNLEQCTQVALDAIRSSRFLFTPETLTFLQRGGRIGGAAALLGNMIHMAPVLTVIDGCATTSAKVHTRKKALEKILADLKADVEAFGLKRIVVHYIGDKTPAVDWARKVIEPYLGYAVRVLPVSPVIGMHVGPAIGIAYECCQPLVGKLTVSPQTLVCTH